MDERHLQNNTSQYTEDYLTAYGDAHVAARRGEMAFTTEAEGHCVGWAAIQAYSEQGYARPGRVATEATETPLDSQNEEFLAVYRAARLRIIEGERTITLPVSSPYERIDFRQAVIEACREAGVPLLTMHTQPPEVLRLSEKLSRLCRLFSAVRIRSRA